MSNSKHTPGPWEFDPFDRNYIVAGRKYVALGEAQNVSEDDPEEMDRYPTEEEGIANARLIAAAPDLLAALRDALADLEEGCSSVSAVDAARAAIRKAVGDDV